MAKSHSVNLYERIFIYDEYTRRDAMSRIVLTNAKRYFKAKELKRTCKDVATPVNLLYVSAFDINPLETVKTADKRTIKSVFKLKDRISFGETYWDNVLFNIHILESTKIRDIRKIQYVPAVKNEHVTIGDTNKNNASKKIKHAFSVNDRIVKTVYVNKKELISYIDSYKNYLTHCFDDSFNIIDSKNKIMGVTPHEVIYVNDKSMKDIRTIRYDIFRFVDMLTNNLDKHAKDSFTIFDSQRKNSGIYKKEHINILPVLLKELGRRFTGSFGISDSNANGIYKDNKEQIVTISDDERKALGIVRKELIHLTEIYWDNVLFLVHITENIRTSDSVHKFIGTQMYEALNIISTLHNTVSITSKENISFDERRLNGLFATMYEKISIADNVRKTLHRTMKEHLTTIRDKLYKHPLKVSKETVTVTDSYKRIWQIVKDLREYITTVDKVHRDIYTKKDERIYAADKLLKHIEHRLKDKVSTNESFNRSVDYNRDFSDFIKAGDKLTRKIGKNPMEDILIWDAYIRASNSYIEVLRMVDKAEDEKWFDSMVESMPNYEEFSDFYVGDYEYEKACIRLVLSSSLTDSAPTIYDVAANIDIDDTDDRGTVKITDTTAATKVYYNKHYYNAPEVQVSVNSGMGNLTVTPYILRTDGIDGNKRYFEVELRNDDGERVAGYISWVSKGW